MRRAGYISVLFVVLGLFSLLLLLPLSSSAQRGAPLPGMMPGGVYLPAELGECCTGFRIGSWVEYSMVARDTGARVRLTLAAVGREEEAWWIELIMSDERGEVVSKLLMETGDGALGEDRLLKIIIQPEGHMPLELPVKGADQLPFEKITAPSVLVGTKRVRVRAGTFETRHYRRGDGEKAHHIWLSDKIALWGLVRYRSPRVTLSLRSQGTGAVSKIVGDPVPFDPSSL